MQSNAIYLIAIRPPCHYKMPTGRARDAAAAEDPAGKQMARIMIGQLPDI